MVVLAIVSVYASGYRLGEQFTLERTGGIHISVPLTNAKVFLDGKEVGVSSFLDKSFFLDNLPFGAYEVMVQKEGYRSWGKTLIVERSLVTDTSAFLVPKDILPVLVALEGGDMKTSTTTRVVVQKEYDAFSVLFEVATSTATSTSVVESAPNPIELLVREGNVYVHWNRDLDRAPSAFCVTPRACVVEISVELSEAVVTRAEFFKDGIVYQTKEGDIYFFHIFVSSFLIRYENNINFIYKKVWN